MSQTIIRTRRRIAEVFEPLRAPARYKGAYGGRGSGKSHFFAEETVELTARKSTRLVAIREIQNSIKDSVRQLIVDKIQKFNLGYYFNVLDHEIRGNYNDSLIIFRGMQSYNAETIKSLEGYDVAWVEEAQTLSNHSLELLRPTLRKEGSELWFGWNPRLRTDPVDAFFRKRPLHPDAISVQANWRDNPWFPEVLNQEMTHDFKVDPDTAAHVWEGAYGMVHGAILARWVNKAYKDGRIGDHVAFDPELPVEISADLGRRDTACWWFWQRKIGGYSLIDYDEGSGLSASDWLNRLQLRLTDKGYRLGMVWLPHDAKTKTFAAKHSGIETFIAGDPDIDLVGFGAAKVKIVPRTSIEDRINAGRELMGRCEFAETACETGIDGLLAWEYEYDEENNVFRKTPLPNFASHPSDAYTYGCQVMKLMPAPEADKPGPKWPHQQTANELFWGKTEQRGEWV